MLAAKWPHCRVFCSFSFQKRQVITRIDQGIRIFPRDQNTFQTHQIKRGDWPQGHGNPTALLA